MFKTQILIDSPNYAIASDTIDHRCHKTEKNEIKV